MKSIAFCIWPSQKKQWSTVCLCLHIENIGIQCALLVIKCVAIAKYPSLIFKFNFKVTYNYGTNLSLNLTQCTYSPLKKYETCTIRASIVAQHVRSPFGMPVSESWLLCSWSSFLLICLGRQQMVEQTLGSLLPIWETCIGFQALGLRMRARKIINQLVYCPDSCSSQPKPWSRNFIWISTQVIEPPLLSLGCTLTGSWVRSGTRPGPLIWDVSSNCPQ